MEECTRVGGGGKLKKNRREKKRKEKGERNKKNGSACEPHEGGSLSEIVINLSDSLYNLFSYNYFFIIWFLIKPRLYK